jgi:hypothetical protein
MDERRIQEAVARAVSISIRAVSLVATHFPLHAEAVRGELQAIRVTDSRWSRILATLASLRCVPGPLLNDEEKESRAHGLRLMALVEKMVCITSGMGRVDDALQCAEWFGDELLERLVTQEGKK